MAFYPVLFSNFKLVIENNQKYLDETFTIGTIRLKEKQNIFGKVIRNMNRLRGKSRKV